MSNIKDDVFGADYQEETYSKGLSREDTIERQVRMTAFYYSSLKWDEFEYSLKALIGLLPKQIQNKISVLSHDISGVGIEKHYKQFVEIQNVLESDTNMIFKKRFIKTYE